MRNDGGEPGVIGRVLEATRRALSTRSHRGASQSGVPLPPPMFRMGGAHFQADEAFVGSAVREVRRLESLVGLNASSRVLDWGCGAGRLAVGVAEVFGRIALYHGVDIQRHLIAWAQRHIGSREGFRFTHVDVANARYNPRGAMERLIPGETGDYDIFYAYSVFSHLRNAEVREYLKEVHRLLRPGGRALLTAFVEDDVPEEEENPVGYGPLHWQGPLHCVRFERAYFERMIDDARLDVRLFTHGGETDGQSCFVLEKPSESRG